jgi:DNA-nicking Smr family endonuclease
LSDQFAALSAIPKRARKMKQKTPAENEEQPTENEQQHVQSPSTPSPKKELSVTVAQADEDETAAIVRDAMQYAANLQISSAYHLPPIDKVP